MSASRDQLNEYLKQIDITGKVCLDIGVQDKPTRRLTKGEPKAYYTHDIDKQWNPDWIFDLNEEFDCLKIGEEHLCERIDVVFCMEVLEHCWNSVQTIENIYRILARGGTAYISTPFINPHHDYWDYVRFTGEWYEKVLKHVGFTEVTIKERVATKGRGLLEAFYKIEGLRVSKIRPEYGKYTYPIGYFVEAKK